jgi:hypothetical protein
LAFVICPWSLVIGLWYLFLVILRE